MSVWENLIVTEDRIQSGLWFLLFKLDKLRNEVEKHTRRVKWRAKIIIFFFIFKSRNTRY